MPSFLFDMVTITAMVSIAPVWGLKAQWG